MSATAIDYWVGQLATDEYVMIDRPHRMIHDGSSFFTGHAASLATTPGTLDILVQTSTKSMHPIFSVAVGGDMDFNFYEGTTITATDVGTELTPFNKARYATATAVGRFAHTPTVSAVGTSFPQVFLPGGGLLSPGHADGGYNREVVLKTNENYLARITNSGTTANKASLILEWYEV